jgi:hypothetical protein
MEKLCRFMLICAFVAMIIPIFFASAETLPPCNGETAADDDPQTPCGQYVECDDDDLPKCFGTAVVPERNEGHCTKEGGSANSYCKIELSICTGTYECQANAKLNDCFASKAVLDGQGKAVVSYENGPVLKSCKVVP